MTFRSDHDLLKNYSADWRDGGARFPKPEWTPANQYPISHTMDVPVVVELQIEIAPPDACPETGTIHGEGPGGMLFEMNGVSFIPGMAPVKITSDRGVEKKIQELDFRINWSIVGTSVPLSPSQTINKMFVTMGTPTWPRWPGATLKRMQHAVRVTGGANSVDPHKIVKWVMEKYTSFNLDVRFNNEWELGDEARDATGDLIGADCQTIVRYTESVIRMVGCPGTTRAIVVWAKPSAPTVAIENDWPSPSLNNPNITHPTQPWLAFLKDGNSRPNAFEACLKFDYGGRTVYYAGGVGELNNKDQVLRVFQSLSWFKVNPDGTVNGEAQVIYRYR